MNDGTVSVEKGGDSTSGLEPWGMCSTEEKIERLRVCILAMDQEDIKRFDEESNWRAILK